MAQKVTSGKERKEKDQSERKKNTPFLQVDKHSDPISNFISNFINQFKKPKRLGLGRLFGGRHREPQKRTAEPESIIGATKTVFQRDYNNSKDGKPIQTNKKSALKNSNPIKVKQDNGFKPKKPKFRL